MPDVQNPQWTSVCEICGPAVTVTVWAMGLLKFTPAGLALKEFGDPSIIKSTLFGSGRRQNPEMLYLTLQLLYKLLHVSFDTDYIYTKGQSNNCEHEDREYCS
jgi:hypothetical protein